MDNIVKYMTRKDAAKAAKTVGKILGCDCSVYDLDDETLYINTGEDSVDFALLMEVKKQYNIEAVNIDDDYEGYIILQIDLRTDEERALDEEIGSELSES